MFQFNKVLLFAFAVFSVFAVAEDLPFWKKKPQVYEKIKSEHFIAVSARTETLSDGKKQFSVNAGGMMRAPRDFVFSEIKKFNELPDVISYIRDVKWNPGEKTLYIHASVVGVHLRLTLQINEMAPGRLFFTSIEGGLLGMKGQVSVTSVSEKLTEVGVQADYVAEKIYIPSALVNFGLELAMQRLCGQMRHHIESNWKNISKIGK